MEMELKIIELASEYKNNRDAFLRVRAKTKKKVRDFQEWLENYHLRKNNIIENEKRFFSFCERCEEIILFECRDFNLAWKFALKCRCERVRERMEKNMRNKIERHKKFIKEKEVENEMQRLF